MREAAHERPIGVAHDHLARRNRAHAIVVVEKRLTGEREVARDGVGRCLPDCLLGAFDDMRVALHAGKLQLRQRDVDLGCLQGGVLQRSAAHRDQRLRVVVLPQCDALILRQTHGAEPQRIRSIRDHAVSVYVV